MWFKNLTLYRITARSLADAEALDFALAYQRWRPCGPTDWSTLGWVAPIGEGNAPLVHAIGGYWLVCLQSEEKILPAAVVNAALAERIAEIEARESRRVRRKEKEDLRDAVMAELLPKAFTRRKRLYAFLDTRGGWLLIDSATANAASQCMSLLHKETVGRLQFSAARPAHPPVSVLTGWLSQPEPHWVIGSDCVLQDPGEESGKLRCTGVDLGSAEMRAHLAAGARVERLAVEWRERLACVLCADGTVRRLRFLDIVQEQLADSRAETLAEEMDARFALMAQELSFFVAQLIQAYGGEAAA